ncbi:uncharacterized protein LOC126378847 [Pectinophora gossypiella]|uniref:uncharacterized protein LOC126378847 n=1 Tax=Pectinophora gossypiella TaxID=13191 RepID=UPI00214F3AB2|nr:uncharacterized protein LOC126378847 [Pectinophora gossypiella]
MISDFERTGLEPSMADAVEGGAALAWRLLATLEGGSLVLATTAILAYTARNRSRQHRPVGRVLVTDTTSRLGSEIKRRLESYGCIVSTVIGGATSGAAGERVDALVVIGAETSTNDLDGISGLVSKDVYDNLKLLDLLAARVRTGGYMAWACAGGTSGAFSGATDAFDAALRASLQHVAKNSHCEPVWVGRCETAESAAERVVAALVPCTTQQSSRFSIRNAAYKISGCIGRWLKIVT